MSTELRDRHHAHACPRTRIEEFEAQTTRTVKRAVLDRDGDRRVRDVSVPGQAYRIVRCLECAGQVEVPIDADVEAATDDE